MSFLRVVRPSTRHISPSLITRSITNAPSPAAAGRDLLSTLKPREKKFIQNPRLSSKKRPGVKAPPTFLEGDSVLDDFRAPAIPEPPKRPQYHLCVHASPNNTILHFTDPQGNSVTGGRISSGMLGFKKVQRGQFEAGFQCALKVFARIQEEWEVKRTRNIRSSFTPVEEAVSELEDPEETGKRIHQQWEPGMQIEVLFRGFGQGREALFQALMTSQGAVVRPLISRLTDRTPIKIGGTRSKKARRL